MKYFLTRTFVVWAVVLLAFFLASGANIQLSEWSNHLRMFMLTILIFSAGMIAFRASNLGEED